MTQILRRAQARRDLLAIWSYVAADDADAADRLLSRMEAALTLIADHPGIGSSRDQWRAGTRGFVVGRYILLYEPMVDGIRLLRVLHGSRDLANLLRFR